MKRFLIIAFFILLILIAPYGCTLFGIRLSEEPDYKLLKKEGHFEIREYPQIIVAETYVQGEFREAGNKAFRKLAGYIFGKNVKKQEISMTVPVMQEKESEKISMTMPVVQEKSNKGWRFAFVMPAQYTLETLPIPDSPDVKLTTVNSGKVAVIRFSGGYGNEKVAEKTALLQGWLDKNGYKIISSSRSAWYDPPWAIPFLRRNEIQFDVE